MLNCASSFLSAQYKDFSISYRMANIYPKFRNVSHNNYFYIFNYFR